MDANALTDDQTAVYDRQLRVWGVQVQRKLTAARVLIVGCGKLAAEVAKNITLAGVGHVTLLDDSPAKQQMGANFLITTAATEQQTAAEAAAKTLQAMNPLVKVSATPGNKDSSISAELIQQFDLVVAVGLGSLGRLQQLDEACRTARVMFMAAAASGPGGWYFIDLGEHRYTEKGAAEEATLSYATFKDAFTAPQDPLPNITHPMYLVLLALLSAEAQLQRPPITDDLPVVQQQLHSIAGSHPGAPTAEQLSSGILSGTAEFAPVCAVLGSVIANNIVMAVSASGLPLNNLFYYTLFDGNGVVETQPVVAASTGKAAAKPQQQQVEEVELD